MEGQSEYLQPGESISQRKKDEIIDSSVTKEVEVVNVVSPILFFVKLRAEIDVYFVMKQSLAIFYGSGGQGSSHRLAPYMLRPLHYTAVNFSGIWIRLFIYTVCFTTKTVMGMSVDFGKVLTLEITEYAFYPLHRLFASLPPQAVHCRLLNVQPIKTRKCELKGIEIFYSLTGIDRKLGALFVQSDQENADTYDVVLVDITNEEEPSFIVEKMVDAGCVKMSIQSKKKRKTR